MEKRKEYQHTMSHTGTERGISSFATIGAFVGLGVVFLIIFFVSGAGKPTASKDASSGTTGSSDQQTDDAASSNKEAPFIRIPQNSLIYNASSYDFMFAYPDSFDKLTETKPSTSDATGVQFSAESALADKKPVGQGAAILNGALGAYVYKKDDFKISIADSDVFVAPTKTGDDITWKVVARSGGAQNYNIGDAYPAKSVKSQTGITVFDFGMVSGNKLLSRWVFNSGDNFVLVALPYISRPDGSPLTDSDRAAYNIIGSNIARTVRIPSK